MRSILRRTTFFLLVTLASYSAFLLLWNPVSGAWARAYSEVANLSLGRTLPGVRAHFRPHEFPTRRIDTEIVLAFEKPAGLEAVSQTSSLSGSYLPSALLIALIVATPLSFARKVRAAILGLATVHVFEILLVGIVLFDLLAQDPAIRPVQIPPWILPPVHALAVTVGGDFHLQLVVTCAIFFLVTFGGRSLRTARAADSSV